MSDPLKSFTKLVEARNAAKKADAIAVAMAEHCDARIEKVRNAVERASKALRPIAGCIFNDNGDMTVDMRPITHDERVAAYFALAALEAAMKEPTR